MRGVWVVVVLLAGFSSVVHSELIRFHGICDGSAGIQTADQHLLFAYDELNYFFQFPPSGGHYSQQFKMTDVLGLLDAKEMDLEAVASGDKYHWWLGSHGRDGDGKKASNRRILFRTEVDDPVKPAGRALDLLDTGLNKLFDRDARARKAKKGGINFEGLALSADNKLMVGVRSPLSDGKKGDALIIEMIDPFKMDPPETKKHWLNLNDRGIRALHRYVDGYLLIAGSIGSKNVFTLYYWQPGDRVYELPLIDSRLNAEAIVPVHNGWLIVSDDGKKTRADESAADGDRKCDKIRRKNPLGHKHPSVYFRAQFLTSEQIGSAVQLALRK